MTTIYNDITTYITDAGNYSLIAFMFISIIIAIICIILFAKWLTMGPKIKSKWHKLLGKASSDKGQEGVKIKGKEIVIQDGYVEEIQEKIRKAETPQQLLEYQIKLESHLKQKKTSQFEIKAKENEKLEKLEAKVENKKLKSEAKIESSKLKSEEKEIKSKEKNKKRSAKELAKKEERKNG